MKSKIIFLVYLFSLVTLWSCATGETEGTFPDTQPPEITSTTIIPNSSVVGSASWQISFSEPVQKLSANAQLGTCQGTAQLKLASGSACYPLIIESTDKQTWTVDPYEELSDGYYVLVLSAEIEDSAGNRLGTEQTIYFTVEDALSTVANNLEAALKTQLASSLVTEIKQSVRETAESATNDLMTVIPLAFDEAFDVINDSSLRKSIKTEAFEILIESLLSNVAGKSSLVVAKMVSTVAAAPPSFDMLLTSLASKIATKSGSDTTIIQTLTKALVSNLPKTGASAFEIESIYVKKIIETTTTVVMQNNEDKLNRDSLLAIFSSAVIEGAMIIEEVNVNISIIENSVSTTIIDTALKIDSDYEITPIDSSVDPNENPEVQSCNFGEEAISDNQSVIAYENEIVSFGGTCIQEIRICNNGILSGSFSYESCQVTTALDCSFNNKTILNGEKVTAYETSSVAFGTTCSSETRSCSNGTLSGSFTLESCTEQPPSTCNFNDLNISHAGSVIAYEASAVPYGQNCKSETRSCSNGALSGTFSYKSCEVMNNTTTAVGISLGEDHACAVLSSGKVKCWGENTYGNLGDGTTDEKNIATEVLDLDSVVAVSSGNDHTCALLSDKTVSCWGNNDEGQIGDGTKINRLTPVKVSNLSNVISLSAGQKRTCAILADGSLKCWGYQRGGPLATSDDPYLSLFPNDVDGVNNVVSIDVGWGHTCVVLSDNSIHCWGYNNNGELGDGTLVNKYVPTKVLSNTSFDSVSAGYEFTCAVKTDATCSCWGDNEEGKLGNGLSGGNYEFNENIDSNVPVDVLQLSNVKSIKSHYDHSCALLNDGKVKCWGDNTNAQIGDGTSWGEKVIPTEVLDLVNVNEIDVGDSFSCALLNNGKVKCWGRNYYGQLGNGTDDWESSKPVEVLGL